MFRLRRRVLICFCWLDSVYVLFGWTVYCWPDRSDSLFNMRISAKLGGLANPGVKAIAEADAVLDISGGDSFADIYGIKRFKGITQPKQLSIDLGTPLILLPQTYGPFDQAKTRREASAVVKKTSMAWARDERSFESLKELFVPTGIS